MSGEERTGHSVRGEGGKQAGRPRSYEQRGTIGHVKRVGRLEKDCSWDSRYLAQVPATLHR